MTHDNDDKSRGRLFKGGVALFALLAFCVQPLLPFAPSAELAIGGLISGLGVLLLSLLMSIEHWLERGFTWMFVGIGALKLLLVFFSANDARMSNDSRCLECEQDILSAKSTIPDGADIFQALQCRPQVRKGFAKKLSGE